MKSCMSLRWIGKRGNSVLGTLVSRNTSSDNLEMVRQCESHLKIILRINKKEFLK